MKAKTVFKQTEIGEIPEEWEVVKLEDYAEVKGRIGWRGLKKSEYTEDGPYLIANKHIKNQRILWEKCDHISEFRYEESSEIQLILNDVIMSKDGTIGEVAFIDELPGKSTLNSTMMLIRITNRNLYPKFVYYFLQSRNFRKFINEKKSGTSIPHIFQRDMRNYNLPLPPNPEQQNIAEVLSITDNVIQKSEKIIQKTQLLKKSLMHQLLTRGINHTKFKQTEIGEIPEEWNIVNLDYVCTPRNEIVQPNANWERRFVGLEHVDSGNPRLVRYGLASDVKSSKLAFYVGDILYGKLRPYLDKAVIADFAGISSTDLVVFTPKKQTSSEFLIHIIHSSRFIQYANLTTTGTNHPRTSWNSLKEFSFGLPPLSEQQKIASIISEIDKKIDFETTRKDKLEQIKQGLMNDLLTGKKRLN